MIAKATRTMGRKPAIGSKAAAAGIPSACGRATALANATIVLANASLGMRRCAAL